MQNPHKIPKSSCPACAYEMDWATSVTGTKEPKPGDYSICLHCGLPLCFSHELKLEAVAMADVDPDCRLALFVARAAIIRRNASRN